MDSLFNQANNKLFRMIRRMDPAPQAIRPVTFWFYSESELKIYHTAHHLQKKGFAIVHCGPSIGDEQLLIAEKKLTPGPQAISAICSEMFALAAKFGITFDGWETMISME